MLLSWVILIVNPPKDRSNPNYQAIAILKMLNFTDLAKYHSEKGRTDITHKVNRIDYQFSNNKLLLHTIHTFTQNIPNPFFYNDHYINRQIFLPKTEN